jgi:PAS domain S-box-containing protein
VLYDKIVRSHNENFKSEFGLEDGKPFLDGVWEDDRERIDHLLDTRDPQFTCKFKRENSFVVTNWSGLTHENSVFLFAGVPSHAPLSEEKFSIFIDELPVCIQSLQADGMIVWVNETTLDFVGRSKEEYQGHLMTEFFTDLASPSLMERFEKEDSIRDHPMKLRMRNGQFKDVKISANTQREGNYSVCVIEDLTVIQAVERELKRSEDEKQAALESNQQRVKFLATLSHEVRTPLNVIVGLLEDSFEQTTLREVTKNLELMMESAMHLQQLMNDMLDVSRLETSQMQLHTFPFNLQKLMNTLHGSFKNMASRNDTAFQIYFGTGTPKCIVSDPTRLRQILSNLITNALTHTEHGKVTLFIETSTTGLHFLLEDTGTGILPDEVPFLFKEYFQSKIGKLGGVGLGLYLCAKLVSMMGGDLKFRPNKPFGSIFSFELPCEHCIGPVKKQVAEVVRFEGHVLVAEDNSLNSLILCKHLQSFGCLNIDIARDGEEVVRKASEITYDLILMDVQMPLKTGIQATSEIRKSGNKVPIVGVSAAALDEQQSECLAVGMNGFLAKPVLRLDLGRMILSITKTS